MTTRIVGIVLVVVGVAATLFGLGAKLFWTDDDGHHDGREPTFALDAAAGADELIVEHDDATLLVSVERAGQRITSYDDVHEASAHVFVYGSDLDSYRHVDMLDSSAGVVDVEVDESGEYRVVFQGSPSSGPDLLELGTTVVVDAAQGTPDNSEPAIADDDVWTNGSLTIERQGLDFVLSDPWDGESYHGGPAFLTLMHTGDMAFVHGHAVTPDDNRFRFSLDLPARGRYLAALEFVQDGELVTALFRFDL